jgi:rubrerythrin
MTGQAAEDQVYGVVSVLYHALQGTQTYEQYANDARKAGDSELEEFFNTCRAEEIARAKQAKSLLLERLDEEEEDEAAGSDEDEEEDEDEDEESEDEE